MPTYATLDYLPDLTYSEMQGAGYLAFTKSTSNSLGWDYTASTYGAESYALLHANYRFTAVAGATYDIFSTSYFDPYLLEIFDSQGNVIEANSESDDPGDYLQLDGGLYSRDVIWDWVAPYTGTYYVNASWNQGSYYKFYSIDIYEDIDTAMPVDTTVPTVWTFSPADELTGVAIGSNINVTFTEAIAKGTGNIVLKTTFGQVIAIYDAASSSNLSILGNTLTINPSTDLAYETAYKLEFSPGTIKDLAGNSYAGTTSYNFTTTATNPASQTFIGTSANEFFSGGTGNDTIIGGAGIDTSIYTGTRSQFILNKTVSGFSLIDMVSTEGTDTLIGIERLQFADKKLALDLDPTAHGGQALEFIGLLAPSLISDPSVVGLILGLFDQGQSMHDVCQLALNVGLVRSIAGSDSDAAIAAMAYRNIIGVEADAPMVDMLVSFIDGRNASYSHADFLTVLSGLDLNQMHIGLVGLQQTGIEYA